MALAPQPGFHTTFMAVEATQGQIRDQIRSLGNVLARVEGQLPDPAMSIDRLTAIAAMCEATAVTTGRGLEAVCGRLDQTGETLAGLRDGVALGAVEGARIARAAEAIVSILENRDRKSSDRVNAALVSLTNANGSVFRGSPDGKSLHAAGYSSVGNFDVDAQAFVLDVREQAPAGGMLDSMSDDELRELQSSALAAWRVIQAHKIEHAPDAELKEE